MKRGKWWVYLGVLAGILLLAGAAFLTMRLLRKDNSSQGTQVFQSGNQTWSETRISMERAPELPPYKPEMAGAITGFADHSMMVTKWVPEMNELQGPAREVALTKETGIYRDVTNYDGLSQETVQQVVEPIALSDLRENELVLVWGHLRGDRLIAEAILVIGSMT